MLFLKKRIYADAGAATPLSAHAKKELLRLLSVDGNPDSLHREGVRAHTELALARSRVASALGAHPEEIIFTAGGTEGNNVALYGVLQPLLTMHKEIHAVTSSLEHLSVLEPLQALEVRGLSLTTLAVDGEGYISPKALREAVHEHTALVSIQLLNSEVGVLQPLREIAKEIRHIRKERLAEGNSLPFYLHCDASQAPLWVSLHTDVLGVDLLTLDGQKILGPKGIGALFIKRGTSIAPVIYGGGQERNIRSGTPNVPLIGAFSVALEEAQADIVSRCEHVAAIRDFLFQEIRRRIPEVLLHGPQLADRVANNLNISIPGLDGETAVIAMDAQGVALSTRSACSTDDTEVSHVLKALHISDNIARGAIRITFLPSVTQSDAKKIARILEGVVHKYKIVV